MSNEHPYTMTIDLNVLNHLGIGLYSNVPAVLSEIVANSWDADATEVMIDIDPTLGQIVIMDNGNGMTNKDINRKYLKVGYRKRVEEPGKTKMGRDPMGSKGIGKLSVFSIADTVEVYSVKDGERNGLVMNSEKIKASIEAEGTDEYHPDPTDPNEVDIKKGTKIVLKDLKKNLSATETYLRKRLARRFSVMGASNNFRVLVNGDEISAEDRDYYDHIEFLWYLGEGSEGFKKECKNLEKSFQVDNVIDHKEGLVVKGWVGTVDEQKNIDDSNNSIVLYARGKLIQEDVLKDFKEGGIYSKYIIGDIDADFMDLEGTEDIITSNRQSVKEDDPRYQKLKSFVGGVLKRIQSEWTDLRIESGAERALKHSPIKKWYDNLLGDNKDYARKLFGKIESLKIPDKTAKKELYKASLMAFEKMALKNTLSILDKLETEEDFATLTKIFKDIDEVEAAHYYQIVKGRLDVVKKFEQILPVGREKLLQEHIFDHLWLLHPSWERASSNFRIEEAVTKEFAEIDAKLSEEEKKGRIDIRYKTAANKHIIIELKRYDRSVTISELVAQITKYRDALEKCLRTKFSDESRVIECICILGAPPEPREHEERNIEILKPIGARYITYDTLIQETLESYKDYLAKERKISELIDLIEKLDTTFV